LAVAYLVGFAKCLDGPLPFNLCTTHFGVGSLMLAIRACLGEVGAFPLLIKLLIQLLHFAMRLETQLLLSRHLFAYALDAGAFRVRSLALPLSALSLALGALVFTLRALVLPFEPLQRRRKLVGKLGNACVGCVCTTTLGLNLLGGSVGPLALGVGALTLSFRLLPCLERALTLHLGATVFIFRSTMFLLCAPSLSFSALRLGFGYKSGFFGALSFLFGTRALFTHALLFFSKAQLKLLD